MTLRPLPLLNVYKQFLINKEAARQGAARRFLRKQQTLLFFVESLIQRVFLEIQFCLEVINNSENCYSSLPDTVRLYHLQNLCFGHLVWSINLGTFVGLKYMASSSNKNGILSLVLFFYALQNVVSRICGRAVEPMPNSFPFWFFLNFCPTFPPSAPQIDLTFFFQ